MACGYYVGSCSSTFGASRDPHSGCSDPLLYHIGAAGLDKDLGGAQVEEVRGDRVGK